VVGSRGNNVACCIWGAILIAILVSLMFWPMLRDWIEGEEQHSEAINELTQ